MVAESIKGIPEIVGELLKITASWHLPDADGAIHPRIEQLWIVELEKMTKLMHQDATRLWSFWRHTHMSPMRIIESDRVFGAVQWCWSQKDGVRNSTRDCN